MRGLVLIRERRSCHPTKPLATLALLRGTPTTLRRRQAHAQTLINRLNRIRLNCGLANRTSQDCRQIKRNRPYRQMKARTEGEVAAKPLGDLSPFTVARFFIYVLFGARLRLLICFRHLVYHFFAYFAYKATFIPAVEVVEKKKFSIFLAYGAGNILVHNVGYEILRQTS